MSSGDCSLTIANVSTTDGRLYEIQIRKQRRSWGPGKSIKLNLNSVPQSLPVISAPAAVSMGMLVEVKCSVPVSCPSQPPHLVWLWERGGQEGDKVEGVTDTVTVKGQLPQLVSSLSFSPSHLAKPRLRCEAVFPGDSRTIATTEFHLKFTPVDVSVEVHTMLVREGGSALLACVCKADPPASIYHWTYTHSGNTHSLPNTSPTVRIHNVTRDMVVQCSARNALGQASSPPTNLNVQYAPVILRSSTSCQWEGLMIVCRCTVDSNPPPLVTWSVNGSDPPLDFNTTSAHTFSTHTYPTYITHSTYSYLTHTVQETLQGPALMPLTIACYAFNAIGNDSHIFLQENEGSVWALFSAVCVVVLFLLFLFLMVLLLCRWRRAGRRRRVIGFQPPVFDVYQDHFPLYINCSEVTNIYTNGSYQIVYQNCTPCFIHTSQINKRQRRGARRQRVQRETGEQRETETPPTQTPATNNSETAIYVEVI
ncbi:myelin-associated glycoprotein isoform X2 [Hoplias malabaricus]